MHPITTQTYSSTTQFLKHPYTKHPNQISTPHKSMNKLTYDQQNKVEDQQVQQLLCQHLATHMLVVHPNMHETSHKFV